MIATPPPPGTSTSWTSPQAEKKAKLERLQNNASHIGILNSPYFPKSVAEYVAHETSIQVQKLSAEKQKLAHQMEILRLQKEENLLNEVNVTHSTSYVDMIPRGRKGKNQKAKEVREYIGITQVLMEESTVWKKGYEQVPDKRDTGSIWGCTTRAAWPEQVELKAEGEYRLALYGERRLPLPRYDRFSPDAVRWKVEQGATVSELAEIKGDGIAWYERDAVQFEELDVLQTVERERISEIKTWNERGNIVPPRRSKGQSGRNSANRSRRASGGNTPSRDLSPHHSMVLPYLDNQEMMGALQRIELENSTETSCSASGQRNASGVSAELRNRELFSPELLANRPFRTQGFAITAKRAVSGGSVNNEPPATPSQGVASPAGTTPSSSSTKSPNTPPSGSNIRPTAAEFIPGALSTPTKILALSAFANPFASISGQFPVPNFNLNNPQSTASDDDEGKQGAGDDPFEFKNEYEYMQKKGFGDLLDSL
ncbi:hypothetical protein BGZ60DRAFT_510104 [Tricladium varicosporioides]|nr:hypothetical protein BGZ60DRAFT_510104 [Hymenoscyphus varicosporioides]